jgi:phosphocarrier protein HPr
MVKLEATFRAAKGITPELAAAIIQRASGFEAITELEMGATRVVLGSLIGILSLELRQGSKVRIIADGSDEEAAAKGIRELIEV